MTVVLDLGTPDIASASRRATLQTNNYLLFPACFLAPSSATSIALQHVRELIGFRVPE
jgi:hypothetical protein